MLTSNHRLGMPQKREKKLPPEAAVRAIYFDFEGLVSRPPALTGVLCEGEFEQVVHDEGLELAASEKGLSVQPLRHFLEELVDRCHNEERCLVAFSQSEKERAREATGIDLEPHYRDARMIAKRWINRLHGENSASVEWRLKNLAEFVGWSFPTYLGDGVATKRLRDVRDALEKRENYAALTGTQKGKWTRLLKYNRLDCFSMRDLVIRASSELAVHARG